MEILAGLVRLTERHMLPAPWYNRPSLGLLTNTPVYVGVLKATTPKSVPPDIIVTPLQAHTMHYTTSAVIDMREQRGVVAEVLEKIDRRFNVALAETVTIDQRSRHRITLVLEFPEFEKGVTTDRIGDYQEALAVFQRETEKIDRRISWRTRSQIDNNGYMNYDTDFDYLETSIVDQGRIECRRVKDWLADHYYDRFKDEFDFDRVVVSSSTGGRFIRYIFPRKGAFEVTISHNDAPGSLVEVFGALSQLNFNILLSRLSRSVGRRPAPRTSIYVAICEPDRPPVLSPTEFLSDVRGKLKDKLKESPPNHRLNLESASLGRTTDRVAYPYRHGLLPSIREIYAPRDIQSLLAGYTRQNKRAIFVSYQNPERQAGSDRSITEMVNRQIQNAGCTIFDGFLKPAPLYDGEATDVRARMWMAAAAVFIVRRNWDKKGPESDLRGLSPAQLIEWGFIYGQGKPWVVIVHEDDAGAVENFMIPKRSFVTYKEIDSVADAEQLEQRIGEAVKKIADLIAI